MFLSLRFMHKSWRLVSDIFQHMTRFVPSANAAYNVPSSFDNRDVALVLTVFAMFAQRGELWRRAASSAFEHY